MEHYHNLNYLYMLPKKLYNEEEKEEDLNNITATKEQDSNTTKATKEEEKEDSNTAEADDHVDAEKPTVKKSY